MKHQTLLLTCLSAVVLAVGFVTGCATDNYQKGAGTASALNHASELIAKGSSQIDDALAALNNLVSDPQTNLTEQYTAYVTSVDNLDATAKDVAAKNEAMQAQGAAYFEGWDNEIATMQNEDIRNRSETRRNEVAARFARIGQQYAAARAAFQPFMSDLHDVQKALSTDLTSGGLAAIKDTAAKSTQDAVPLKETLARLSDQFRDLSKAMSPTTAVN
jgi:chromosome segregation ATPase